MSTGKMVALYGSVILITTAFPAAFAQESSITIPIAGLDPPIIDGVWTSSGEWNQASTTIVNYTDSTQLLLKTKHDWDSLYILLEMPMDYVIDGHGAVCLDTLNDGGPYMNPDDYCFVLGSTLKAFRGDGRTTMMKDQIPITLDVQAERGLSGSNSPYGSRDHVTYEFKIPLSEFGDLATEYGLYVTFDTRGETNNYTYNYSWPDFKSAAYLDTPSPRAWGQISLSPDTNVPEFPVYVVGTIAAIVGIMAILSRTIKSKKAKIVQFFDPADAHKGMQM